MSQSVTYNQDDKVILVKISGDVSSEEHYIIRDKILNLVRKKNCSRVLVDSQELDTGKISTMVAFFFAESVARMYPSIRIAHIIPKDAKSRSDVKFVSDVEANRGLVTGKFETYEEARMWLCQS
ncbi:hypothetical protein JW935_05375 [candidate division KSB1 bacterium]|nr:hypothetical protein [candidate division KSB1 bacterium]